MSSLPIGTYNNDPVLVTPVSGVQSVWFVFVMSGFEQCLSILLCEFHLCTVVLTQLRGVVSVHLLTGRHDVSTVLTLDFLVPSFINNELPVVEEGFAAAKAFPRIGTRMLVLEVLMEGRLNGSTCLTNLTVSTNGLLSSGDGRRSYNWACTCCHRTMGPTEDPGPHPHRSPRTCPQMQDAEVAFASSVLEVMSMCWVKIQRC